MCLVTVTKHHDKSNLRKPVLTLATAQAYSVMMAKSRQLEFEVGRPGPPFVSPTVRKERYTSLAQLFFSIYTAQNASASRVPSHLNKCSQGNPSQTF